MMEQNTDVAELTETLLYTWIGEVISHEKEVINGDIVMKVDKCYRFIGKNREENSEEIRPLKFAKTQSFSWRRAYCPHRGKNFPAFSAQ